MVRGQRQLGFAGGALVVNYRACRYEWGSNAAFRTNDENASFKRPRESRHQPPYRIRPRGIESDRESRHCCLDYQAADEVLLQLRKTNATVSVLEKR